METMHTTIVGKDTQFNSPTNYDVLDKKTGKILQSVNIQKGPVLENGLNGVFIEDLLLICIDQLEAFQNSTFACRENEATLSHLYDALATTRARQYDRLIRGVQGRYSK